MFSCVLSAEKIGLSLSLCTQSFAIRVFQYAYLTSRSTYGSWHVLVGKLMNQGICVFLPLVDRGCCLFPMQVCPVILGQPLYFLLGDVKKLLPQNRNNCTRACPTLSINPQYQPLYIITAKIGDSLPKYN